MSFTSFYLWGKYLFPSLQWVMSFLMVGIKIWMVEGVVVVVVLLVVVVLVVLVGVGEGSP